MSPEDMQTITALLDHHATKAEIAEQNKIIIDQLGEILRLILKEKSGMTAEQQAEIIALNSAQQQKVDALIADPK